MINDSGKGNLKMGNSFVDNWTAAQDKILTENGALTYKSSGTACVDLFFQIGALRGADENRLYTAFSKAFGENPYIATRIMLWARDIRGGAGERKIFRDLLNWMEINAPDVLALVIPKIPELGRFDDLLVFKTPRFQEQALDLYDEALRDPKVQSLAAKWAPSEGSSNKFGYLMLRNYLGLSPRQYRKVMTRLRDVVEQKMTGNDWSSINYSHVPSLAQSRYKKAFYRHDGERYSEYGKQLVKALTDPEVAKTVKVNAAAVYPYDVLKNVIPNVYGRHNATSTAEADVIRAQWEALPNYMGDKNMLAIVDVSGSMSGGIVGSNITPMTVAVSLGLYMATKNKGAFKNIFMTFSTTPDMVTLTGDNIVQQVQQISTAHWDMSTNLDAALKAVLDHAVRYRVPQNELPEFLVVLSDMEFDAAGRLTLYDAYKNKFEAAGYVAPKIVWWNIQSRQSQAPVRYDQRGSALVSGFSPSIVKSILAGQDITPESVMLKAVMSNRYDLDMVKNAA